MRRTLEEGGIYSKSAFEDAGLSDLLRRCWAMLGLKEGATAEEIEHAFHRLRDIQDHENEGAEARTEAGQWERLKEIAWAKETLLDYLRTHGSPPPDAGDDPAAPENPHPRLE